jgi:small subunit ribosomal protein S15
MAVEVSREGITGKSRAEIVGTFKKSESDCGSSEVQIALLTDRIVRLTGHFETHRDDKHSRRGMMMLISRRKKLLSYLKESNPESYKSILASLGLRK